MTYKTRQDVLRAAADWMDVCAASCVTAKYKYAGTICAISDGAFVGHSHKYEFPIALLEGKEVWVGSELYDSYGRCVKAEEFEIFDNCPNIKTDGRWYKLSSYSWAKPKPATVMVEMPMRLAEFRAGRIELNNDEHDALLLAEDDACKKALEKL